MKLFTIGYTGKSAREFFGQIRENGIDLLVDVRLHNSSQLSGYAKSRDLAYFLSEICGCDYLWAQEFAPTAELRAGYKSGAVSWNEYEQVYHNLLKGRDLPGFFAQFSEKRLSLLCACPSPERCHRRLVAEALEKEFGIAAKHL